MKNTWSFHYSSKSHAEEGWIYYGSEILTVNLGNESKENLKFLEIVSLLGMEVSISKVFQKSLEGNVCHVILDEKGILAKIMYL